jgi:hypothetical protein
MLDERAITVIDLIRVAMMDEMVSPILLQVTPDRSRAQPLADPVIQTAALE